MGYWEKGDTKALTNKVHAPKAKKTPKSTQKESKYGEREQVKRK